MNIRAIQTDTSFLKITRDGDPPLSRNLPTRRHHNFETTRKLFAIIIISKPSPDSRYTPASLSDADTLCYRRTFDIIHRSSELSNSSPYCCTFLSSSSLSLSRNEVGNEVFCGNKIATCFQFTKHKFRFICRDDLLRRIINIRGYVICCAILAGVYCY